MADEIIRLDYSAEDIGDNIDEVRTARGTFDTLDDRLDNIEGGGPSPSNPIASNCVSPMTGYSKSSSSTPGNISTDDTLNAAIGKLEKRTELNENNILSVADQSTQYNIAQGRARTLDSVTSTVSGYTITFSGTSSGTRSFSFLEPFSPPKSGDYVWKYTNGVTIGGTPISVYMWDATANVGVNATDIEGGLKVNLNSTHFYTLGFTLQNNAVVSGDYSVMIISKDLWDKGFTDFQPHALSNAELTALADLAVPTIPSTTTLASYAGTLAKGYHTAFIVNGQNPSDSPVSDNCFVDFFVYSANTAQMRVYPTYSTYAGEFYVRTKVSGSWGGWYKFQGTAVN